jgi:hypothetical protein
MIIEAFGNKKDVMDWLNDVRINPEVTRDVLVKRFKRGDLPEEAITTPVNRGASIGDTKQRIKARAEKTLRRVKMFKLAQRVRREYDNGVAIEEIMERHGLSKSQVTKIGTKMEWFNCHWSGGRTPDAYKTYVEQLKEDDGSIV